VKAAQRYLEAARREARPLAVVIVIAAIAIAIGYTAALALGLDLTEYWTATIPTVVSVIAGIGVAWWGIRVANAVETAKDVAAATERRRDVLMVIQNELDRSVRELRGDRAAMPREVVIPFLPTEAWRSLSASGELRWIDNPNLIAKIANAYHRIDATTTLERALFDFNNDPARFRTVPPGAPKPQQLLTDALVDQDPKTIAAIDDALAYILQAVDPHGPPYVSAEVAAELADKPEMSGDL